MVSGSLHLPYEGKDWMCIVSVKKCLTTLPRPSTVNLLKLKHYGTRKQGENGTIFCNPFLPDIGMKLTKLSSVSSGHPDNCYWARQAAVFNYRVERGGRD